jgi:ubiquinone/menaquinone biosynthesis C-methylase UbiE
MARSTATEVEIGRLQAVAGPRYDEIASRYSNRPDDYSGSATVALLDLTGPVGGRHVLDLACGHGTIARELARRGATVVGVDLSIALLQAARASEAAEPLGVVYVHADVAEQDLLLGSEPFEVVTCHFGLTDIDDLEATVANVARVLSTGGVFVFSILHPCFPGVDQVSGSWRPDHTYYDEEWWLADGELSWIRREVGASHRMVSTYINTLVGAGLVVERIDEPRPDEDWARERPGAAALPVYLVVACRKP